MFCNLKTDREGPRRLQNKAATRVVKKNKAVAKNSPEALIIDNSDVDVPEDTKPNLHHIQNRPTYPHKHVRIFSSDPSKKQPLVISLSSGSMSSPTSSYKPKDDVKIKGSDGGTLDSEASSAETEYEQASTSRKRKPKVTPPARKAKKVAAEELDEERPPVKSSKGKQPALAVGRKRTIRRLPTSPPPSDEGPALHQDVARKVPSVQSKQLSSKQDAQPLGAEADDQTSEHHTQPVAAFEASSAEDLPFYTAVSCPQVSSKTRGTYTPSYHCVSCN